MKHINRDATIIQVAVLLIIIAILGVAILKEQRKGIPLETKSGTITPVKEANIGEKITETETVPDIIENSSTGSSVKPSAPTKLTNTDNLNIVKSYFRFVAEKDYAGACSLIAGSKCNANKPVAVENFSTEFKKLANGYEYINIADFGFSAPSGKDIVCVKYSYTYKNDPQPGQVSEVMSFYVDTVGGELKITDRVCEKKYKDGRGLRDCPIIAAAEFCEGWIR